jgi:AraC family transcriptional regulator of adaptative response/methylated-DNA-[protein]-cysteine methyltransferase
MDGMAALAARRIQMTTMTETLVTIARSMPAPASGSDDIRFATGTCALGTFVVARSVRGICALLLGKEADALVHDLRRRFAGARAMDEDATDLLATVARFLEAPGRGLDLPLDPRGTAFQLRVWQALRAIPAGHTASYAEVADRIGTPAAVRAVAQACAANNIAVAIPCHRVVRSDGTLSGYRWGVERKRALLAREAAA